MLQNPSDATRCALLYANKGEQDVWLRHELDALAAANPDRCGHGGQCLGGVHMCGTAHNTHTSTHINILTIKHRFHVRYVLEQPPPGWTGSGGRVRLGFEPAVALSRNSNDIAVTASVLCVHALQARLPRPHVPSRPLTTRLHTTHTRTHHTR